LDDCLYPVRAASTAYKKGCRCDRCKKAKADRLRDHGYWPRERVADTIRPYVERQGIRQVAAASGVPERTLFRILNGATEWEKASKRATGEHVKLTVVDRMFCSLDLVHLFLLPPEDGGYADLYLLEPLEQAA